MLNTESLTPNFKSSMELIAHAHTHRNGKKWLDAKLAILHLAQAVELILKDLLLKNGISIFDENKKSTRTIHGCLKLLKGKNISIGNFHHMELLINQRNSSQHSISAIDDDMLSYYTFSTYDFFTELLKEHYDLDFNEILGIYLKGEDAVLYGYSENRKEDELKNIRILSKVYPSSSYLSAWSYLETVANSFIIKATYKEPDEFLSSYPIHKALDAIGISFSKEMNNNFEKAYYDKVNIKNPDKKDVIFLVDLILSFENFISNINIEPIKESLDLFNEEMHDVKKEIEGMTIGSVIKENPEDFERLAKAFENIPIAQILKMLGESGKPMIKLLESSGVFDNFDALINNKESNK